jgi:hypothetical protein
MRRPAARLRLESLEGRALPSFGFGWAFNIGGPKADTGSGIATDGQGNVYVSGFFNGTNINFDPLGSPYDLSAASAQAFAASYSPSGYLRWAEVLGSIAGGLGGGIAVQGPNVYVAAGGGVVQLDAGSGAVGWTVSIPGAVSVAVGPASGNVYVAGGTSVTQVSASGTIQWTQTTSGGTTGVNGVAVYDAPNSGPESVYVTGTYTGTVTFGATTLTSPSSSTDTFVWKLNSDSTSAGAAGLAITGGSEGLEGIAVDGAGNAYVTGTSNTSSLPIYVAKVGPTLVPSWTDYISSHGRQSFGQGYAVAVDMAGHVYTTGSFYGTLDFDPGPGQYLLTSGVKGRAIDIYVSELDSAGNFVAAADLQSATAGGGALSRGLSIAVDNSSLGSPNVYTTGQLRGTVDFDPTAGTYDLTSYNSYPDVFVSKLTQPSQTQPLLVRAIPPAIPSGPPAPIAPASGVHSDPPTTARTPAIGNLPAWLGLVGPRRRSALFADWLTDAD